MYILLLFVFFCIYLLVTYEWMNVMIWGPNWGSSNLLSKKILLKKKKKLLKSDHMLFRKYCSGFFPVRCFLVPLGQHCIGFFLYNVVSGVLKQDYARFLCVSCCQEYWPTCGIPEGIDLCNAVPKVLIQHWRGFFFV